MVKPEPIAPLKKKKKRCKKKKKEKKKKVDWEIFYSDGSYVTSEDYEPHEVPLRIDVQVIIQADAEHNWSTLSGYDTYAWDTRGGKPQWFGGDRDGLNVYLQKPGHKCVLFGYHIDKYLFRKILNKAIERRGEKSGYNSTERHP